MLRVPVFENNGDIEAWDLDDGTFKSLANYLTPIEASFLKFHLIKSGEFVEADFANAVEVDVAQLQLEALIPEPHSERILHMGNAGNSGIITFPNGKKAYFRKNNKDDVANAATRYSTGSVKYYGTTREIHVFEVDTIEKRWDDMLLLGGGKENNHSRFYAGGTNNMRWRQYWTGSSSGGYNHDFAAAGTPFEDKTGRGAVAVDHNVAADTLNIYYADELADTDDPWNDTNWGPAVFSKSNINPSGHEFMSRNQELIIGNNSNTTEGDTNIVWRYCLYGDGETESDILADFWPPFMTGEPDGDQTDRKGVLWLYYSPAIDYTSQPRLLPDKSLEFGDNEPKRINNRTVNASGIFTRGWTDGLNNYVYDTTNFGFKDGVADGSVTTQNIFQNNGGKGTIAFWVEFPFVLSEAQRNALFNTLQAIRVNRIENVLTQPKIYDFNKTGELIDPIVRQSGGYENASLNEEGIEDPKGGMEADRYDISDNTNFRVSEHMLISPSWTSGREVYKFWLRVPEGVLDVSIQTLRSDGGATDLDSFAHEHRLTRTWQPFVFSSGEGNFQDFYCWITEATHNTADNTATQLEVFWEWMFWKHNRTLIDPATKLPLGGFDTTMLEYLGRWWGFAPNYSRCLFRMSSGTMPIPATSEEWIIVAKPVMEQIWNSVQTKNHGMGSSTHASIFTGDNKIRLSRFSGNGTSSFEAALDDQWKHARPLAIKVTVNWGVADDTHTCDFQWCELADFDFANPDNTTWIDLVLAAGSTSSPSALPTVTHTIHLGHNSAGGTGKNQGEAIYTYARWKSDGVIIGVYDPTTDIDPDDPQNYRWTDSVSGLDWTRSFPALDRGQEPAFLPPEEGGGIYINEGNILPLEALPAQVTTFFEDGEGNKYVKNIELALYENKNLLAQLDGSNHTFLSRVANGLTPLGAVAYEYECDEIDYNKVVFNPTDVPWEANTDYIAFVFVKAGTGWDGTQTNDFRLYFRGTTYSGFKTAWYDFSTISGEWELTDAKDEWESSNLIPDSSFLNSPDDDAEGFDTANNGTIKQIGDGAMIVTGDTDSEIAYFRTREDASYANEDFVASIELKAINTAEVGMKAHIQLKRNGNGSAVVTSTVEVTLTADWVEYPLGGVLTLGADNDRAAIVLRFNTPGQASAVHVRRPKINQGSTQEDYENTSNPPFQHKGAGALQLKDGWALLYRKFRLGDYEKGDNIRFEPHGSWKNHTAATTVKIFIAHPMLAKASDFIPWHSADSLPLPDWRGGGEFIGRLRQLIEYPFIADEEQMQLIFDEVFDDHQRANSSLVLGELAQDTETGEWLVWDESDYKPITDTIIVPLPSWSYGHDWTGPAGDQYAGEELNVYGAPAGWEAEGSAVEADGQGYLRHPPNATFTHRGLSVPVGTQFEGELIVRFTGNAACGFAFRFVDDSTYHTLFLRYDDVGQHNIRIGKRSGGGAVIAIANVFLDAEDLELNRDYLLEFSLVDNSGTWEFTGKLDGVTYFNAVDIGSDQDTEDNIGAVFIQYKESRIGSLRANAL